MNDSYSNRELDMKFENLQDKMEEHFNDIFLLLNEIKEQTTKTNGRVSKLEGWRSWFTGGVSVLTLIGIPIMGWILYETVTLHETISSAVQTALIPYAK